MTKTFMAGALGAALAGFVPCAAAQTVDHGSLQQLFGESVTTSATGKPQRAGDVPATMEIVTAEEIGRSGATSIPDILRRVAGIDVLRWGIGAADVAVRGYNQPYSPRLLVLVDGRQVYLDHYGMTAWSTIPVELAEIRQIEIVKGPSTALFGFNAVGGVVNIVTYSPLHDDVRAATVRLGTQRYREASAVATVKFGETAGIRLSAGGYDADESGRPVKPGEEAFRIDPRRRSVAAAGMVQLAPNRQLGAELTRSSAEQTEFLPFFGLTSGEYDTWSAKLHYAADTGIGLIEGTAYRNQADVRMRNPYLGDIDADNTVTVVRLQDLFKVGPDHSIRLSAEYRRNEMNSVPDAGGEVGYDVYSAGGMWEWTVTDAVTLVNAVRLDRLVLGRSGAFTGPAPFSNEDYDRTLTEASFNGAVVYKPTGLDTLRFTVGRGIQVPSLIDYGLMQDFTAIGAYGNPELEPTVVTNYEVGYDRALPRLDATLRTALYYQTTRNVKSVPVNAVTIVNGQPAILLRNLGNSSAVGGEAGIEGTTGTGWRWSAGYAAEMVDDDLANRGAAGYVWPAEFENATPRHKLNAALGRSAGRWTADVHATWISGTEMLRHGGGGPGLEVVDVPSHLIVSARLGYAAAPGVTLAVSGMNVTQSRRRTTSGPEEERRILFSATAGF
ncbi:MAG TPA: TonB-dependent receptor [Arenibaculum sp.]|nr:TonB-dependent receptor [Arenibaculum sp.]